MQVSGKAVSLGWRHRVMPEDERILDTLIDHADDEVGRRVARTQVVVANGPAGRSRPLPRPHPRWRQPGRSWRPWCRATRRALEGGLEPPQASTPSRRAVPVAKSSGSRAASLKRVISGQGSGVSPSVGKLERRPQLDEVARFWARCPFPRLKHSGAASICRNSVSLSGPAGVSVVQAERRRRQGDGSGVGEPGPASCGARDRDRWQPDRGGRRRGPPIWVNRLQYLRLGASLELPGQPAPGNSGSAPDLLSRSGRTGHWSGRP